MAESIGQTLKDLYSSLPQGVEIVAVSKFQPAQAIEEAYFAGQRAFGESRAAELVTKAEALPKDIKWHFIGHLQTNKVKSIINHVFMIESVDSRKLLDLIDKVSAERNIVTNILMQVHVAAEESKYGWTPDELLGYFEQGSYKSLRATRLRGLMGMATNTDDVSRIESDFKTIHHLHGQILRIAPDLQDFNILSMGMSDDYPVALKHGATHIRIGSKIFGQRKY